MFGTIPEWLNLGLGLLLFFGFAVNQREQSMLKKKRIASGNENNQNSITENNVEIRAELYSRILIGIMLGLAISPIFSWVYSGTYQGEFYYSTVYTSQDTVRYMISLISAIILSTFLSFVYFRAYPSLSSLFVHWVERFAFSFAGFWVILLFAYLKSDSETHIYFLNSDKFTNVIVCLILFILVGFPSTPVDWLIYLRSKLGTKKA